MGAAVDSIEWSLAVNGISQRLWDLWRAGQHRHSCAHLNYYRG